jgi:hypothetical protein
MQPQYTNGHVQTRCPDCGGAITTFECNTGGNEFGSIEQKGPHYFANSLFSRVIYKLMRCASCGRGGLAKIHCQESVAAGTLENFYPISPERAKVPEGVPQGVLDEVREAEICMSVAAHRAASALLRSALEKALAANGYTRGTLQKRIDEACEDQVITAARRQRAHEDVRVLGNDILHDEWREISAEEAGLAHHYVQRVLEDLYDDRPTTEGILRAAGRLPESAEADQD